MLPILKPVELIVLGDKLLSLLACVRLQDKPAPPPPQGAPAVSSTDAAVSAGVLVAFACKQKHNLAAKLIAGSVVNVPPAGPPPQRAVAIGIDLDPHLSVAKALETILWTGAITQLGDPVLARTFPQVGAVALPLGPGFRARAGGFSPG